MRFDLTDLRLFLYVFETGTITAAAERCHMTLASASARIRGMESMLGTALLLRTQRGVQVTDAGRTLQRHARVVLQQMELLRGDLSGHGAGFKSQVRMLCNTAALSEYLPRALASFLRKFPDVSIDVEERASQDVVDALRDGLCDIGVVSDAVDLTGLRTFAWRDDPLVLIVPAGHALRARRTIAFSEVLQEEFIGLVAGSALQEHIGRHARKLGRTLSYRVRLRSLDALCRMVGQGVGMALVPRAVAVRAGRGAGIRRIALSDAWADRHLVLCVRDGDALPLQARQLIDHLLAADD